MRARSEAPRVALVLPSLKLGGMERMAHELACGLHERRAPVAVFLTAEPGECATELVRRGVTVLDCGARRPRIARVPLRLTRQLARFRPDIIHAHSGSWLPATVAKLRLGYPRLVFTDHGRYLPEPRYRARLHRFFAGRTDRVTAVSAELADYLLGFLALDRRPDIIANGVDTARYEAVPASSRARLRAEWNLTDRAVLLMAVGRLEPVKDHARLLDALVLTSPRVRLALMGTGRLEQALRRRAVQLGVAERVIFLGHRRDVPECLAAADVFVSSSTSEGLPVSLLEAMAAGLPIVATAVGGIPAALGAAGVLVPPSDTAALADALVAVAGNAARRAELGNAARARAQRYSLDACVQAYCDLYDAVLEGAGGGNGGVRRADILMVEPA